ncbi:AEC family transporter [Paracoccus sp. p4-l81]|uniref:AEC family transporter n=1 Tax=unclassified Paracoccus (in: a-proteobacteria) TaxID=2688777 RepID=UPI0035BA9FFB
MEALLTVILPVFLVIGYGYGARWSGLIADPAIEGIMRFAQNFAVPVLLFRSIAQIDLGAAYDLGLLTAFYAGAFAGFFFAAGIARFVFHRPGPDCIAIGFCGLFSNSLLLGIPITQRAYGAEALAGNYSIISIHSPLLYTFGITMMEFTLARGQPAPLATIARRALTGVLKTPLVIGIMAGFAANIGMRASGHDLPEPIWAAVTMVAGAALPAALFGLGGVLYRYRPEGDMKLVAVVAFAALILHPAIAYVLTRAFGTDVAGMRSAVVTAAMAPGVNAYLFANMYGAARRVAASSVLVATAASVLTIWFWLAVLP